MTNVASFETIFGRNLVGELKNFVPRPYLVATMADLAPLFAGELGPDARVYEVRSMEEGDLEADLPLLDEIAAVVGLGGGQALDAAKYFAWRRRLPLFQLPTSLSVDAVFGHRAGVRRDGMVRYLGWAVPQAVYVDYDVIQAAPRAINRCGVGDVLCFYTGVLDWQYATARGKCEAKWPYDQRLSDISLEKVEQALAHQDDIRDMTDRGIEVLIDGHKWGGASYHGAGWNPRHIEGIDHFFFYALEALTGRKFLHGQPVCLGTYIGTLLHGQRAEEILQAIHRIGVDIRPEAMGVTWEQVAETLIGLGDFVRATGLWYGIAHDAMIGPDFVARLRAGIEDLYGFWQEP